MAQPAAPAFVVTLDFHSHAARSAAASSVLRGDLSACHMMGSCLWLGLDIEGIAVRGDRVFVGLRGPVLRGWAMIIALEVRSEDTEMLALNAIGPQGEPYRLHLLDLGGLGIRDLLLDGDDLVILAGPTMDLDGPSRIYRWPEALRAGAPAVVPHEQIDPLLDVPYGEGVDHAEGIALIAADGEERRLLVVYDSPAASRLHEGGTAIDADVFVFPSRAPS